MKFLKIFITIFFIENCLGKDRISRENGDPLEIKHRDGDPTYIAAMEPEVDLAKKYVYIAAAAYCYDKEIEQWTCTPCHEARKKSQIIFTKLEIGDNFGIAAVANNGTEIVISFRGTLNFENLKHDFDMPLEEIGKTFFGKSIQVHTGFLKATNNIFPSVRSAIREILGLYPKIRLITLTGTYEVKYLNLKFIFTFLFFLSRA